MAPGQKVPSENVIHGETPPSMSRRKFLRDVGKMVALVIAGPVVTELSGLGQLSRSDEYSQPHHNSTESPRDQMANFENIGLGGEIDLPTLVEYAKNTTFGTNNDGHRNTLVKQVTEGISTRTDAETAARKAFKEITGRELVFDIDPSTGEKLPDTTEAYDVLTDFIQQLESAVAFFAILPKNLMSLPTGGYHFYTEQLPGLTPDGFQSVDAGVVGQVNPGIDMVSLSFGATDSLNPYLHELVHIVQHQRRTNGSDQFRELRAKGIAEFESLLNMRVELKRAKGEGEIDDPTFVLASELINKTEAEPNPDNEDEAGNISTYINRGLLPESEVPIIKHLRAKQILALRNLSIAAQLDIVTAMAFFERFGGPATHPKTLASLAEAGILDHMSIHEGKPTGQNNHSSLNIEEKSLTPGTQFINIADPTQSPEYLTLNYYSNTGDSAEDAYYNMVLHVPGGATPEGFFNLREESTDNNPIDYDQADVLAEEGGTESGESPFRDENEELVKLLNRIFPGLIQSDVGYLEYGLSDKARSAAGGRFYSVRINGATLMKYLKPNQFVGRIGLNGDFEWYPS